MSDIVHLDVFDRRIIALLQRDARLTNNDLAARVHLSASQCSRRRTRLEADGYITGYVARFDADRLGFGLVTFIHVTLATHNRDNAKRFAALIDSLDAVQEAHALTGEMDYLIKVVSRDLRELAALVNDVLLPHEAVQNVKSSIALETLKDTSALPISEAG